MTIYPEQEEMRKGLTVALRSHLKYHAYTLCTTACHLQYVLTKQSSHVVYEKFRIRFADHLSKWFKAEASSLVGE